MLKFVFISLFILVYLRKISKELLKIKKTNRLIEIYNLFGKASTEYEKQKYFEQIVRNRPLSNELIGFYFDSPSYRDSITSPKIPDTYYNLHESRDYYFHRLKKYFNPRYAIMDILSLPASVLEFIFSRSFTRPVSMFFSSLGWIATILISAYANELREIIDKIVESLY